MDLNYSAAARLDILQQGTFRVSVAAIVLRTLASSPDDSQKHSHTAKSDLEQQ